MNTPRLASLLPLVILSATIAAQPGRVAPPYFAGFEGNTRHTYPFGRAAAKLQLLLDPVWVTSGRGVVTALAFRADGFPASTYPAYAKRYKVTLHTTPVRAAAMTIDPVKNAGGAAATVAFQGAVSVPSSSPPRVVPRPFGLRLGFARPYSYDAGKGSLLATIETDDAVTPPGRWTLDAALIRTRAAEAMATQVADRCANAAGDRLTITPSRSRALVGGALDFSIRSSRSGAFPRAVGLLGATIRAPGLPFDLGAVGMPGCLLAFVPLLTQVRVEGPTGYPNFNWPIPNAASFAYQPIYVQALGLAAPPGLTGSVTSRAHLLFIGPASAPPSRGNSIFWVSRTNRWFMSAGVDYLPIVRIEGVLP